MNHPSLTKHPSTAPFTLTFKIIEDSTWKARPKLIDSRGYSYGVKMLSQGQWLDMHQKTQGEYNFIRF